MRVVFPHCVCTWDAIERKATTVFHDGTQADATPHDTPEYHKHAAEKGTGDIDQYCWGHDLSHCIVAGLQGKPSAVLYDLAHGGDASSPECEAEERAAQAFQKAFFLR